MELGNNSLRRVVEGVFLRNSHNKVLLAPLQCDERYLILQKFSPFQLQKRFTIICEEKCGTGPILTTIGTRNNEFFVNLFRTSQFAQRVGTDNSINYCGHIPDSCKCSHLMQSGFVVGKYCKFIYLSKGGRIRIILQPLPKNLS